MKKILFIGNNASGSNIFDGQHGKARLYLEILKREGFQVSFIELDGWKKHPFSIIRALKKGIKTHDVVLLMAAINGARMLIPLINFFNKKYNRKTIYSQIGIGIIDRKKIKDPYSFFLDHKFENYKDSKMKKNLQKFSYVVPETNILKDCYQKLFCLTNCYTLTNFRDVSSQTVLVKKQKNKKPIKAVYFSRVSKEKGVFRVPLADDLDEFFGDRQIFGGRYFDIQARAFDD